MSKDAVHAAERDVLKVLSARLKRRLQVHEAQPLGSDPDAPPPYGPGLRLSIDMVDELLRQVEDRRKKEKRK